MMLLPLCLQLCFTACCSCLQTYKYEYKAPGSSQLVQRVSELLSASGLACKLDKQRGFDHGVFVPLSLLYPDADVPVVVLSLLSSLDPAVSAWDCVCGVAVGVCLQSLSTADGQLLPAEWLLFCSPLPVVVLTNAAYLSLLCQCRTVSQGIDSSQAAACRHTSGWESHWRLWQKRECWCWALA